MANNVIKRVWNQNRMVAIEDLKGMTFQAESGGHTFQISGVDDAGNVIALSGSVAGVFLRPDNTDVAITGSASGGVVSVTLPANCYDVPGRFGLTVFVTSNGQKTAVYAAMGTVSRTSSGTVSPGTTSDVVDLINRINTAVATIPASWTGLMADIAPTYSDAAVYPIGAYCYYNGDLYRCTTAITTAESWTAGHWTQAVLGNDVSDLKSALKFMDGVVFFYASQKPTITVSGTTATIVVPINAKVVYRVEHNIIATSPTLSSAQTLSLTNGNYLVYDITSNEFAVKTIGEINATTNELILLLINNNGYLYGQWTSYVQDKAITLNEILMDGIVAFYADQKPIISTSGTVVSVEVPRNLRLVYTDNGQLVQSNAEKAPATYTIASDRFLVYDITNNEFSAKTRAEINASSNKLILLLYNNNGYVHGQWSKYASDAEIEKRAFQKDVYFMDAIVYFYTSQRPVISINGTTITVQIPKDVKVCSRTNGLTQVESKPMSEAMTITMSSDYLVYNYTQNTFSTMTQAQINASTDQFVLLLVKNGNFLYGQWERYITKASIDTINNDIAALQNDISGIGLRSIPNYYESHVAEKEEDVMDLISQDTFSFVFITDIHKSVNSMNSPAIIKHIGNNTPVDLMICGGDLITQESTKNAAKKEIQNIMMEYSTLNNMDTLWAIGNHEYNNPSSSQQYEYKQLSLSELVPYFTQKHFESMVVSDSTGAYYWDNPKDNIRIFFISCAVNTAIIIDSVKWVMAQMENVPTEYDIILISHYGIYYSPDLGRFTDAVSGFYEMLQALRAYKNHSLYSYDGVTYNYSSKTGTVIGAFLGHSHIDGIGKFYDIPCIITTCDGLVEESTSQLTRTSGTVTEQAFDVVVVNRNTKTINCVRFGAGEDRSISYA